MSDNHKLNSVIKPDRPIVVRNNSSTLAKGVKVKISLDPGIRAEQIVPSVGYYDRNQRTWIIGVLSPRESAVLNIAFRIIENPVKEVYRINYTVTTDTKESLLSNNSKTIFIHGQVVETEQEHNSHSDNNGYKIPCCEEGKYVLLESEQEQEIESDLDIKGTIRKNSSEIRNDKEWEKEFNDIMTIVDNTLQSLD